MKKEIIINSALNEIRIAVVEDSRLAELYWELPDRERSVGNVYFGKVQRIVQGMNAAFVDIGLKQDAFLHFSDVDESLEEDDNDVEDDDEQSAQPTPQESVYKAPTFFTRRSGLITINLEPGQNVIVQAVREAYGSKGIRVTSKVSLAGRYIVLLPNGSGIGVSKRIQNDRERKRLKRIAKSIMPSGIGCIIRTEAQDKDDATIAKDLEDLVKKWNVIQEKIATTQRPGFLHKESDLVRSLVRDIFSSDVSKFIVDSQRLYKEINEYLQWAAPNLAERLELYKGELPIFEEFGVEEEFQNSYGRVVSLPSGGSIAIDPTEAMIVIDVNSGRNTSLQEQEQNSLRTNLEALVEIARQIRLRDIGGMIVVDFIDQSDERNRRKLYEEMKKALAKDRAKTVVFPITQLGLMQITRQRIRQNIMQVIKEPCPSCHGTGTISSKYLVINAIERWLKRFRANSNEFTLILDVHPTVAEELLDGTFSKLARMMVKYFIRIKLRPNDYVKPDDFTFTSLKTSRNITSDYK